MLHRLLETLNEGAESDITRLERASAVFVQLMKRVRLVLRQDQNEDLSEDDLRDLGWFYNIDNLVTIITEKVSREKIVFVLVPSDAPKGSHKNFSADVKWGKGELNDGTSFIKGKILHGPRSFKHLDTRLSHSKDFVIHEITHFIDEKDQRIDPNYTMAWELENYDEYANLPYEIEAHLLQGLSSFYDTAKMYKKEGAEYDSIRTYFDYSFKDRTARGFVKFMMENHLPRDHYNHLSDDNKKRVIKRLTKLWDDRLYKFFQEET